MKKNTQRVIFLFIAAFMLLSSPNIFAQNDLPTDSVCAGANEFYKVVPTPGSTYDWFISEGGNITYGADTKSDSVRVAWANTNIQVEDFIKVVETNKYGRKGDTIHLRIYRFPVPAATISGSDTLFDGNTGTNKVSIDLTGTAPWTVVYNDGKADITINDIESNPHTIQTRSLSNPPEVHTFSLVSVKDLSGCPGEVSGSANIIVSPPIKTSNIIHN
ncbi:MAG: MPT63 family protein [Bacteroidales bacterium]|nr:MPT63 family protein [Bacteroidales bacterium]